MPDHFLDTSALAKHYHPETGTAEVDRLWNDPASRLIISRLSALEIVSVFAGKVRAGTIAVSDFDVLRRRFLTDLARRRPLTVRMRGVHFQEAERLLRQHGPQHRLRTLDALQLAVVLDLKGRGVVCEFVCADRDLLAVATLEGLSVLDPENP
jgi:predicted nucleic acid-binding protein